MDVTLACEDANSKLVDVVTVADVDDEDRVGNSFLQIWKLRLGHEARVDKFIVKSIITFNKLQYFETVSTRESP